ncbi:MAG: hypothetical protein JW891_17520 [Candidatus Lokiarchaeota archaeon]|nr:hypothetical protein [Candidatus Lokiarchaeota archaeon]
MRRTFTPGRWNYSQRAKKWVFVSLLKDGKRSYKYQIDAPDEFVKLHLELKRLNDLQAETIDQEENMKLFEEMKKIAHRMQNMGVDDR